MTEYKNIDVLFEVSWEVCNKVGGIHTVVATKAYTIEKQLKDNYILIGPYLHRDDDNIPEFIEDKNIFKAWRRNLREQGLNVKIGRWDILGKPLVFLVDFSPLFQKRNEIFTELWNDYKLDSITGQWDYIEPAMFGYAAGMVIKEFYDFQLSTSQKVVAHFHEWMTASGLLFLKKHSPTIATAFTTHATILGRSIAGNNLPLYNLLDKVNPEQKAKEFNIYAKYSMEKLAAANADVFATVSEITGREAKYFLDKEPHVITPNGFESNMVPDDDEYATIRQKSYNKLKEVAEALFGYKLSENVKFISTSGRYEFKNKGFDVFISSLAKLNQKANFDKEVVAYIFVPANNYGPRKDLLEVLNNKSNQPLPNNNITHYLHDAEYDPILNRIREMGLTNDKNHKVKVIFVPAYLNGNDGIFNIKYYDLLTAIQVTAFPSYYEPWGYTPLESLAFKIPTITTDLAGFGAWISRAHIETGDCISVIHRDDNNFDEVVEKITSVLITCSYKSSAEYENEKANASFVARSAQWKNLAKYYFDAYTIAIENKNIRAKDIQITKEPKKIVTLPKIHVSKPKYRTTSVIPNVPEELKNLEKLAKNIWWEWNHQAIELFEMIDPELWAVSERNPSRFLKEISYDRLIRLRSNNEFIDKYNSVIEQFENYMNTPYDSNLPTVAYFSMEFGLTNSLKIYSGGLGILAGDYLKQASDRAMKMIGVGLFYRYGYFTQKFSIRGEQIDEYTPANYSELPMELMRDKSGKPILVNVGLPGRNVFLQIWRINVGRVPLYLLDSDIEKNSEEDRQITHKLYGGDKENRLKQEIILGVGGIRAIRALGISVDVYHSNEGHSAFINLERIRQYIYNRKLTFNEALEMVRCSTLFTTHTPVPAGHDTFPEDLLMTYLGHYPERLNISWEEFVKLGKLKVEDKVEEFSMSNLAANLSQEINGVSWLHGEVTKDMFKGLWNGFFPEELHIGYVTNGVHYSTWLSDEIRNLNQKYAPNVDLNISNNPKDWNFIYNVDDKEIWQIKNKLRNELVKFVKKRINSEMSRQNKSPQQIVAIQNKLNENTLTIGFARRFATYKRAYLLLENTQRLDKLLNNPKYPVQIIFAGKAHPRDKQGQELIQRIIEISKLPQFLGKIIFIEGYDIEVAKKLVQGVDIWLNTPTRPLEASGTSGMKATLNGTPNFSVLDGWWVEGYRENAGWALPLEKTFENDIFQNQLDAEMIYDTLENDIIPKFYERSQDDIPHKFVQVIKNAIVQVAPFYTTTRMLDDYIDKYYLKLAERKKMLRKNDYDIAKKISAWKKRMQIAWENINILSVKSPEAEDGELQVGNDYLFEIELELNETPPEDIKVEFLIIDNTGKKEALLKKETMKMVEYVNKRAKYQLIFTPTKAGVYNYTFRLLPHNDLLPHQQDFPLVRWI